MRTPYPNELMHYGVMGMKWGVRRYQNPDGTLTAEGRRRYGSLDENQNAVQKGLAKYAAANELHSKNAEQRYSNNHLSAKGNLYRVSQGVNQKLGRYDKAKEIGRKAQDADNRKKQRYLDNQKRYKEAKKYAEDMLKEYEKLSPNDKAVINRKYIGEMLFLSGGPLSDVFNYNTGFEISANDAAKAIEEARKSYK